MHRLLVHADQLSIEYDLVELRFHDRNQLVQNISECEISAVSLKKRAADLRPACAVKNQLRSKDANGVGHIALLSTANNHWCRRRSGKRCVNLPALRRKRFDKGGSAARRCSRCLGGAR